MLRGFVLGVLVTGMGLAAGAYWMVSGGHVPANADATPGRLESWAAHTSLDATVARESPKGAVPLGATPENLRAGLKLYQAHCQVCHGGADAQPSLIARGLYQPAPQLAHHGVEDDPEGATYWKLAHGIRLTGMPSMASKDAKSWWAAAVSVSTSVAIFRPPGGRRLRPER